MEPNLLLSTIPSKDKTLVYYAELSYSILHNENSLQYKEDKEAIQLLFSKFNLQNYNEKEAGLIIKCRLSLIDSYYSTNVTKFRKYGIDDIIMHIKDFANSDKEFVSKVLNYISSIEKNEWDDDKAFYDVSSLLETDYGIDKQGKIFGNATSLLSKYCYFITHYNFPIYDSIVMNNYKTIANHFEVSLEHCKSYVHFDKFISIMVALNHDIKNFNKLDNLLWLFGKINMGNYSVILSKEKYLKLIDVTKASVSRLIDVKSDEFDELISLYISNNLFRLKDLEVFDNSQVEFIEFVYSINSNRNE